MHMAKTSAEAEAVWWTAGKDCKTTPSLLTDSRRQSALVASASWPPVGAVADRAYQMDSQDFSPSPALVSSQSRSHWR